MSREQRPSDGHWLDIDFRVGLMFNRYCSDRLCYLGGIKQMLSPVTETPYRASSSLSDVLHGWVNSSLLNYLICICKASLFLFHPITLCDGYDVILRGHAIPSASYPSSISGPLLAQRPLTSHGVSAWPGSRLNIKTVFPGMGIPMLKITRSRDRPIFNMGIPLLVRRHLYIETVPRSRNHIVFIIFIVSYSFIESKPGILSCTSFVVTFT